MKNTLILFIHGLGGNPKSTWGKFGDLIKSDPDLNSLFDCSCFSYPTSILRLPFGKIVPKIQVLAEGLKSEIFNRYSDYEDIILICHSLGGLVARKYLLEEIKAGNKHKIIKLLLFATPNNGAKIASLGSAVNFFLNRQLNQLKNHSDFIDLLNEDWYRLNIEDSVNCKVFIAGRDKIVNKRSANSIWGNISYEVLINKTHRNIVKPQDSNDDTFIYTKIFLTTKTRKEKEYDILLEKCAHFTMQQIELQKKTKKYIPEVFTELTDIKDISRRYADPVLFLKKTIEELNSINTDRINKFLMKYNLETINFKYNSPLIHNMQLENLHILIDEIRIFVDDKLEWLKRYQNQGRTKELDNNYSDIQKYAYSWEKYEFESAFKYILKLEKIKESLVVLNSKILIVTSAAGHGKTNYLCDFMENVISKREVPGLLFFGKDFTVDDGNNAGLDIFLKIGYTSSSKTSQEVLSYFSSNFLSSNKPFVIAIDGINEQKDYKSFSGKLQMLINSLIQFDFIKIIITCRSEYFRMRYNDLLTSHFSNKIFLKEDYDSRIITFNRNRLYDAYSEYFHYHIGNMSDNIWNKLTEDPLFLRIFSEAYGDHNSSEVIYIRDLSHLYKNKIFSMYFTKKKEELVNKATNDSILKTYSGVIFERTIERVVENMYNKRNFMNLAKKELDFTREQYDELDRIIDEDIIIQENILSSSDQNEIINFTFDEFRDYLLAQYILKKLSNVSEFEAVVEELTTFNSAIAEGLCRYIFYSYKETNNSILGNIIKKKDWYEKVFCEEVFVIEEEFITDEDIIYLKELFVINSQYSRMFSNKLLYMRDITRYPKINHCLLIEIITNMNEEQYNTLIAPIFMIEENERDRYPRVGGIQLDGLFTHLSSKIKNDDFVQYLSYMEIILLLVNGETRVMWESMELYEEFSLKYPNESGEIVLKCLVRTKNSSLLDSILNYVFDLMRYEVLFPEMFYSEIYTVLVALLDNIDKNIQHTAAHLYMYLLRNNKTPFNSIIQMKIEKILGR